MCPFDPGRDQTKRIQVVVDFDVGVEVSSTRV